MINDQQAAIISVIAILFMIFVFVRCMKKIDEAEDNTVFEGSLINAIRAVIGRTIPGISLEDYLLVDEGNDIFGERVTAVRNNKEDRDNNFTVVFWHETKKDEVKIIKVLAQGDDATGYEIQRAFEYRRVLNRGIFGK